MTFNLTNILFILIIFQLLFLSFFLFTQQKGKQAGNNLLGLFFLSICVNLLDVFLLNTGIYFAHPNFAGLGSCFPLLFGPLLYLYTKSVIYKNYPAGLKSLLHFLPFVIFFLGTEFYYLTLPNLVQERILHNLFVHHVPGAISIVTALIFIQFLFYSIASLRLVSLYKKTATQLFSNPKHTDVSWLYTTIIFFISVMVITSLNGILAQTSLAKYFLIAFNLVILSVLIFVIGVLMKALRQSYFLSFAEQNELTGKPSSPLKANANPEEKSEKEKIVQTVFQYVQTNKPYLDPELTLNQLASQLSLKPRILSQAINEIRQQTFFDFINHFRIDEATRLLTNPKDKKITILEVLYKVGFNSKSSFNTLFKKYTGITPTEFRQKQGQ
jgi:AraC-like DNA-binding protein